MLPTNEWVHGITPRIGFFSPSIPAVVLGVLYLGEHGGRTMVLVWFLRVPPLAGNPVHCCILLAEVPAASTLPAVVCDLVGVDLREADVRADPLRSIAVALQLVTIRKAEVVPVLQNAVLLFVLFDEKPLVDAEEAPHRHAVLVAEGEAHLVAVLQVALGKGESTQQPLGGGSTRLPEVVDHLRPQLAGDVFVEPAAPVDRGDVVPHEPRAAQVMLAHTPVVGGAVSQGAPHRADGVDDGDDEGTRVLSVAPLHRVLRRARVVGRRRRVHRQLRAGIRLERHELDPV